MKALENLQTVLTAAGARLEDVVKWQILIVDSGAIREGFEAFREVWGQRGSPPAITIAVVCALANPSFLVEIDAIAVIPETTGSTADFAASDPKPAMASHLPQSLPDSGRQARRPSSRR
jgi:hypothetical protein